MTLYFTKGLRAAYDPESFLPVAWQVYTNGTAGLSFKTEGEMRAYMTEHGAYEITAHEFHSGRVR